MLVADMSVLLRHPVFPVYSSYPLHTPILVSQWKAKKTQPRLLANLVVATNYTATVHHDRNQQTACVSLVLSAHRGQPMGVHFHFHHLRPLKYHLKFLHTFALKIPIYRLTIKKSATAMSYRGDSHMSNSAVRCK